MPIYRISRSVEAAHGSQTFLVRAANEQEALEKGNAGDCVYEDEEVEVYSLGEAELLREEVSEAEYWRAENPGAPLPAHLREQGLF